MLLGDLLFHLGDDIRNDLSVGILVVEKLVSLTVLALVVDALDADERGEALGVGFTDGAGNPELVAVVEGDADVGVVVAHWVGLVVY